MSSENTKRQSINPSTEATADAFHFSQATRGASLADVVELMTFHTDLRGEMRAFASVKDEYFPDRYPSWTAVGVTQLALPDLCVEIHAVAVAGCGGA